MPKYRVVRNSHGDVELLEISAVTGEEIAAIFPDIVLADKVCELLNKEGAS